MTDTPLNLDAVLKCASEVVTEGPEELPFTALEVCELIPALVAALRNAEAQVAAVLALCDPQTRVPDAPWGFVSKAQVRAAVDGAS